MKGNRSQRLHGLAREEAADGPYHAVYFRIAQFGIERQRQDLLTDAFGHRQAAGWQHGAFGVAVLAMHRDGVMNGTTDLMFREIGHQSVALETGNDVKMVDVLSRFALLRRRDR